MILSVSFSETMLERDGLTSGAHDGLLVNIQEQLYFHKRTERDVPKLGQLYSCA